MNYLGNAETEKNDSFPRKEIEKTKKLKIVLTF